MWTSRGSGDDLMDVGIARGEESGGEQVAFCGHEVAMGLRDLANDAVGAQEAKLPGDFCGTASLLGRRGRERGRVEEAAEIAVAEAGGCELAPGDGTKEA